MATLNLLKSVLEQLDIARERCMEVEFAVNANVKKLLQILSDQGLLQLVICNNEQIIVKVNKEASSFSALSQLITVRRTNLLQIAAKLVPTVMGNLLIFTRMGVMSHHEASFTPTYGRSNNWSGFLTTSDRVR